MSSHCISFLLIKNQVLSDTFFCLSTSSMGHISSGFSSQENGRLDDR
jgi:hypothetical protein